MKITAYMLSCPEREAIREQTIRDLLATDWNEAPRVEIDRTQLTRRQERQEQTARSLLRKAIEEGPDFILFLEDDLKFNRHLRSNLERWHPLIQAQPGGHFMGSLYNPGVCELQKRPELAFFIASPNCVYGSQAFLLSLTTAMYVDAHWYDVIGMQDIKISRLAARVCSIYYHMPSLVQHVGMNSVWGGHYHSARDFQADWKAS